MIVLSRGRAFHDKFRKYKVFIDDKHVANIRESEDISIEVKPGKHKVCLKIDWCSSNTIEIEVEEGTDLLLNCGNSVKGISKYFFLYYITFAKHKYLWLAKV